MGRETKGTVAGDGEADSPIGDAASSFGPLSPAGSPAGQAHTRRYIVDMVDQLAKLADLNGAPLLGLMLQKASAAAREHPEEWIQMAEAWPSYASLSIDADEAKPEE